MLKSLYRSEVHVEPKLTDVLTKIKTWAAQKNTRFIVKKGNMKYNGNELSSFTITPGSSTGTIVFDGGAKLGITAASATFQDLTFTAKVQSDGFFPNDTQIQYIDPGADGALSISVQDRKIVVTLAYALGAVTSTADDVKAAIQANTRANALVVVTGTAATPLAAQALTPLTGGSSTQTYDKADIISVQRLRSKRWAIVIADNANPAA